MDAEERAKEVQRLKAALKVRKITAVQIANSCYKHPATVRLVLNGNYPYYGGNHIPKYLDDGVKSRGVEY